MSFWESPPCSTSPGNINAPGEEGRQERQWQNKARPRFPHSLAPLPLAACKQGGDGREVTDAFLLRPMMLPLLRLIDFSRGSRWATSFQEASLEEVPVKLSTSDPLAVPRPTAWLAAPRLRWLRGTVPAGACSAPLQAAGERRRL